MPSGLVAHRYSDFRKLHAALKRELCLPKMEEGKRLFHDDEKLKQRRALLEGWLRFVLTMADAVCDEGWPAELTTFLTGASPAFEGLHEEDVRSPREAGEDSRG